MKVEIRRFVVSAQHNLFYKQRSHFFSKKVKDNKEEYKYLEELKDRYQDINNNKNEIEWVISFNYNNEK